MKKTLMIFAALMLMSCGTKYIEDTHIPDTPETHRILNLVEKYRVAMEHRDLKTLKAMLSRKYYENAGTTATSEDDYDYNTVLKKIFPFLKDNVKAVHYQIKVTNVTTGKKKASAEFEYKAKVLITVGEHKHWIFEDDFDRLDFVKEDGVWRIIRGM